YPLGAGEHRQTMDQIDEFRQFSECINCMLCYAACPVYGLTNEFLGPAATALARRYNLDSRDQGFAERLPVIANAEGVWECSFVGECSVVCPKGVDPAKAIQQTKLDTTMRFVLPFGTREEWRRLQTALRLPPPAVKPLASTGHRCRGGGGYASATTSVIAFA